MRDNPKVTTKNTNTPPRRVLCVCLGNICRSPTAEAELREKIAGAGLDIAVDSAGTSAHHVGESPDARSIRHAKARGLDLSACRSRKLSAQDFLDFDLILAMDEQNLARTQALKAKTQAEKPDAALAQVTLFSAHDKNHPNQPLPDPYYGGRDGFERVLDQCASSAAGWVSYWLALHKTHI